MVTGWKSNRLTVSQGGLKVKDRFPIVVIVRDYKEGMQLHQLRYMVSVAEERRFTRAASRLHVAQPSVSSAIAALAQELGAPLFHRARNEVVLTGAGEA